MPKPPRFYSRKAVVARRVCLLIENGVPCHKPVASRGICARHRTQLEKSGRLEEFALRPEVKKHRFEIKQEPEPGLCRLIVNGVPCTLPVGRRGMCDRHYSTILLRPDLNLNDFAVRMETVTATIKRQKQPVPGRCLVQETVIGPVKGSTTCKCQEPIHARGLCKNHYRKLSENSALFDEIAEPVREKVSYSLKKDPKPGLCVIVQDGIGCTRVAGKKRQVCRLHGTTLNKAGLLARLTDHLIPSGTVFEKKPEQDCVDGFCRMVVNGVPCRKAPKRRGLCPSCLNLIEKHCKDDLDKYALPPKKQGDSMITRKKEIIKGFCVVNEDGTPCRKIPHARGLCQHHYKVLAGRQQVHKFAMTEEEAAVLPDIPHWYLDKNVVIDFAMYEIFQESDHPDAIAIVKDVLERKVLATVSFDCIRALYSKLGHRLAWPTMEGGKGLPATEAEIRARAYTGQLFRQRGGLWHILPNDPRHHELCAAQGKLADLTLEDALEVSLFGIAQSEYGATQFVTSDRWILEKVTGMHPRDVRKRYETVLREI